MNIAKAYHLKEESYEMLYEKDYNKQEKLLDE